MSTLDKVKDVIIDKLGVEEESIKPEAHFVNDLGADSLDTVELIMEFEEEFGIEIPDDDAENIWPPRPNISKQCLPSPPESRAGHPKSLEFHRPLPRQPSDQNPPP